MSKALGLVPCLSVYKNPLIPPPCCHQFNWLVVHCQAAVRGEGQWKIPLVFLQKVSRVGSLGTKANMGAFKLGNFSHNTSLRELTTEMKAFGSGDLSPLPQTLSGVRSQDFVFRVLVPVGLGRYRIDNKVLAYIV